MTATEPDSGYQAKIEELTAALESTTEIGLRWKRLAEARGYNTAVDPREIDSILATLDETWPIAALKLRAALYPDQKQKEGLN